MKTKIEVFQLRSGGYWARPAGACGNIGWSPFPWTMTYGRTPEKARAAFIADHKELEV